MTRIRAFPGKRSIGGWAATIAIYALALTWLYPFAWMVAASLKPAAQIYNTGLFEGDFTLDNFAFLFATADKLDRPFLGALGVSAVVTLTVTASVLLTSAFIAFALARMRFPGRKLFGDFLLLQMVIPTSMFILPLFVLVKEMGLLNSLAALILPSMMSGWGIYMMSQSFRTMPEEYFDAARLDRASLWQTVTKIVVPLNKSIIAIVALFTFTGTWDNFLWPLIAISDTDKMPLSVLLATFSKQYGGYAGPVMAGAVLQTLPLVLLFLLFRRHFLQGMSLSLK
ncbi:sugar ABC transporter permease [Sphingomonas sp. Leaf24]|uniref:carbohydrate ABC transporter permease n=1 Tax=unclassified Sphingomonas TaxID=196159 RepID=UPI0006FA30B4|nr:MULTISPECIES: carbohydrate ABC transporter permease [unclassified Sphingomonas]KQM21200.1 sugar ABC transporter permease [Sphingomonas sp. Leaf5]KQM89748.1 sugar ABC transporter permease [Sphingomonas sp. Leaf24]